MAPIFFVVLAGVVGGLAFVYVFSKMKRSRNEPELSDVFPQGTGSTDVINMAHIKVAGVGGLGLVVVALAVALDVPEIGQSQAISAVARYSLRGRPDHLAAASWPDAVERRPDGREHDVVDR